MLYTRVILNPSSSNYNPLTFRSNMYKYLLNRLKDPNNYNNNENLSIENNSSIAMSFNNNTILKFYPNDDYSIHASSLWQDYNYVRSYIRMYSPFSLYKNIVCNVMYTGLCSSIELDKSIELIVNSYKKPYIRLVSIKEGFLVKSEDRFLTSVADLSNMMSKNQDLDELQNICSKIAAIYLTNYKSFLTSSNIEALNIYLVPSKKTFSITAIKNIRNNSIDSCICKDVNISNYLNYSLRDYLDPEGYNHNPFVVNYILPLKLDNALDQALILCDILYS
jgi:hypothetical protein